MAPARGTDAVGNVDSGGAVRDCSGAKDLLHSQQTLVTDNQDAYKVQVLSATLYIFAKKYCRPAETMYLSTWRTSVAPPFCVW